VAGAIETPDRVRALASVGASAGSPTTPVNYLGSAGFVESAAVFAANITAAVAVASGPFAGAIQITTSLPTGLSNGNNVFITGVTGTTEANGTWQVAVTNLNAGSDPTLNFILVATTFANAYVSGGTATALNGSQSVHYATGVYWLALSEPLSVTGGVLGISVDSSTVHPLGVVAISLDGTGISVDTSDTTPTPNDSISFTLTVLKAPFSEMGQ
jgi:hypothetical protein